MLLQYDMSITNENPAHDEEPEPQPIPAARGGSANTQGSLAQRRPAGYDQGPVQNTSGMYCKLADLLRQRFAVLCH